MSGTSVRLSDGALIRFGDRIGVLHLINDPLVTLHRRGLSPAPIGIAFRRQVEASLRDLAVRALTASHYQPARGLLHGHPLSRERRPGRLRDRRHRPGSGTPSSASTREPWSPGSVLSGRRGSGGDGHAARVACGSRAPRCSPATGSGAGPRPSRTISRGRVARDHGAIASAQPERGLVAGRWVTRATILDTRPTSPVVFC
jgi:hypothetical protein